MGLLAFIKAATYALQIWAINARYNLVCRIETDTEVLEAKRDSLLAVAKSESQLAAVRVQQQILRRSGLYIPAPPPDPQPAAGVVPASGPASQNN